MTKQKNYLKPEYRASHFNLGIIIIINMNIINMPDLLHTIQPNNCNTTDFT